MVWQERDSEIQKVKDTKFLSRRATENSPAIHCREQIKRQIPCPAGQLRIARQFIGGNRSDTKFPVRRDN